MTWAGPYRHPSRKQHVAEILCRRGEETLAPLDDPDRARDFGRADWLGDRIRMRGVWRREPRQHRRAEAGLHQPERGREIVDLVKPIEPHVGLDQRAVEQRAISAVGPADADE